MMPSNSARLRPRARVLSGTFSISASEGSVPETSTTLFAAHARTTSWLRPRPTVASGDSSRAVNRNGVSRTRPVPCNPTAAPIRASREVIVSIARSARSGIRGST